MSAAPRFGPSTFAWDSPQAEAADPSLYARVRDALARANYTDEGITKALGVDTSVRLRDRRLPALLRRTGGGSPLETLIRLFILGQPVALQAAGRAVAPDTLEPFVALGILHIEGEEARAALQLRCFQGLVLAWDFVRRGPGGVREDYVMGVSPSSLLLFSMTVRRPVAAALDLGTGCGIQALLAARHAARVVGTDYNPRAVAVARFNARLNRGTNLEIRRGDMFQPVAGEKFDLIVTNPPFIITPDFRHLFLNSGYEGDDAVRRIVSEAPQYLNEGGWCILTANWAVAAGEDWQARLKAWCEKTGCDALVLYDALRRPDEYAATLIEVADDDLEEYARAFAFWMDYYDRRGIVAIGQGVIALRHAGARPPWFGVEKVPLTPGAPVGDDLERIFAQRTWLHSLGGDAGLLEARLQLATGVRLEQTCELNAHAWRPVSSRLRRATGLQFAGAIDEPGAALLAGFDGALSVRDHIRKLAVLLSADAAAITPGALANIRRLVEQGFLAAAPA